MKQTIVVLIFISMWLFLSCEPEIEDKTWAEVSTPVITYSNEDLAGDGALFDQAISDEVTFLRDICAEVCPIIYAHPGDVPGVDSIHLRVFPFDGVARKTGNQPDLTIELSSTHLGNHYRDNNADINVLHDNLTGIFLHEVTHCYSPYVNNYGDVWPVVEGLADSVIIRAGNKSTSTAMQGSGKEWDDGYMTTAFFFYWINEIKAPDCDFIRAMTTDLGNCETMAWAEQKIQSLTGSTVTALWTEYNDAWPWPQPENMLTLVSTPPAVLPIGIDAHFRFHIKMDDTSRLYGLQFRALGMVGGNVSISVAIGPLQWDHKDINISGGYPRQDTDPCAGSATTWEVTIYENGNISNVYYQDTFPHPVTWE